MSSQHDLLDSVQLDFILGSARSGTSLLTRILDEHPACTAKIEKKHVLRFYKQFQALQQIETKHIQTYAKYLKHNFPSLKTVSVSELEEFLTNNLPIGTPINYLQLSKKLFLLTNRKEKEERTITHIVDKNPFYTFHAETLLKINPDAKFVLLVRDYRAVVLSNLQSHQKQYRFLGAFFYAYSWKRYNQTLHFLQRKYPNQCLLVHYEALSGANSERTVNEVCNFLQLSYNKALLEFYSSQSAIPKATEDKKRKTKIKGDLSQPINMERTYAWKTQLSERQLKKIEFIAGQTGRYYGYEQVTSNSTFRSMYYSMLSIPARFTLWCYYRFNSIQLDYRINLNS